MNPGVSREDGNTARAFIESMKAHLGEDEELLWDMATDMQPEDGCLWIHSSSTERWNDVPRGTMDEVSSYVRLNLQSH
jgi:hypothetical protein